MTKGTEPKTFIGRPCKTCQGSERCIKGGGCAECIRRRSRALDPEVTRLRKGRTRRKGYDGIRKEALAAGQKRYFTGFPCVNGHLSERSAKTGDCIACRAEINAARKASGYMQVYYENNKQKIASNLKEYRARNADTLRVNRKIEYERNREYYINYAAAWNRDNPDKVRMYVRTSGHRRRGAIEASERHFTGADVDRILKQQRGRCAYYKRCGQGIRKGFHIDHIKPLSKGGSNEPSNIQLTCRSCNIRKSNRDPEEWAAHIGLLI